ncbi:MAG: hypothetical protein DRJ05_05850 [Bacteroidetes bacterium]|nr:MAG: hypothetical protein DRJ05_05850 [Bacteroidota bacterium]
MLRKSIKYFTIAFVLAITLFSVVIAQVNVYHVGASTDLSGKNGLLYALPQTAIQVDVKVRKTDNKKGPYAEYAAKYLDLDKVILNDYSQYEVIGVELTPVAVPDKDNFYFVELDERATKEGKSLMLSLSQSGLILGLDNSLKPGDIKDVIAQIKGGNDAYSDLFAYFAETNLYEKTDTIIRKVVVDTAVIIKKYFEHRWIEKSNEEKAVEAANMISKIRENRFNLLTGYQEVAYEAGALMYMDQELQKMEKDYLSLFTGITFEEILSFNYTLVPDGSNESDKIPIFNFSSRTGVSDPTGSGGEKVYLEINRSGDTQVLSGKTGTVTGESIVGTGFFYRIPERTGIKVEVSKDLVVQKEMFISQFGVVSSLPVNATALKFHEKTGNIKTIVLE